MDWKNIRIGEVLLGSRLDPTNFNHVRSGFRVLEVLENGLKVRRIHAHYLTEEPIESWVIRWDQLEQFGFQLLPSNAQLPLL